MSKMKDVIGENGQLSLFPKYEKGRYSCHQDIAAEEETRRALEMTIEKIKEYLENPHESTYPLGGVEGKYLEKIREIRLIGRYSTGKKPDYRRAIEAGEFPNDVKSWLYEEGGIEPIDLCVR